MSSNSGEKRRWQKKKGTNLANSENIESLKKVLSAEFRKAEATLKVQELELFDRGLLMPAVNQLRYAGTGVPEGMVEMFKWHLAYHQNPHYNDTNT